jgi:hypothetical protein
MEEQLEKSPKPDHILRVVRDFTKEETAREVEGLKAAVQQGKVAEAALGRIAGALKK